MSLGKDHAVEIDKQQAMDFLKSHNRFLLVGHEHPDGDDVGSICAPSLHGQGSRHGSS